jgi:carbon starvation protein
MNALILVLTALLVLVLAYRFYGAFLAAKVLALDDRRLTPAHTLEDGHDYLPTNKWVLFGHHFAAIAGAGPLIGPVLAAQFGYAPGFFWLILGAVLAGGVHDFMILVASTRYQGRGLAEIMRHSISPVAGVVGSLAILIILIIALAGLGLAVVNALKGSSWGTFTIVMTIPIAILVGLWMTVFRPGKVGEATVIGVVLVLAAVIGGARIPGSSLEPYFLHADKPIILGLAVYGFIASVLPVWLLLCPRDYLSSYLKIGTVAVLVVGLAVAAPALKMPALTPYIHGGGPIIPGPLFPFLFITIACGAISGFHSLVGSGTTPKMLDRETDALPIGYGAMMVECLVGVVALVAACSLYPADYYAINLTPEKFAALGLTPVNLADLSGQVGEQVAGRPGGAVSLAVGFAQIFTAIPGLKSLMAYWYHFAIMFEALFILTTIDAGTRVARFVVQEFGGRFYAPLGRIHSLPASFFATGLVVFAWAYFIWTGSVATLWPMFGTANQLLAVVALATACVVLLQAGKLKLLWVPLLPLAFLTVVTLDAAYLNIVHSYWPMTGAPDKAVLGWVNIILSLVMIACVLVVLAESARVCKGLLKVGPAKAGEEKVFGLQ